MVAGGSGRLLISGQRELTFTPDLIPLFHRLKKKKTKKKTTQTSGDKHLVTSWPNYHSRQGSCRVQPPRCHWPASAADEDWCGCYVGGAELDGGSPAPLCHTNPCLNSFNPTGISPHPQTVRLFWFTPPILSPPHLPPSPRLTVHSPLRLGCCCLGMGAVLLPALFIPPEGEKGRRSTSWPDNLPFHFPLSISLFFPSLPTRLEELAVSSSSTV